jgi:hypothetical protein
MSGGRILRALAAGRAQDGPAGSAKGQAAAAASSPALDAGVLRAVHQDLLGRPPYAAEREAWLGRPLPELLDELLRGREVWEHWTDEQLYYFLLVDNFRPEQDRILALPLELFERRIGVREAIHRIALSSSFDQRNPGPDTFVTVVMEQLLHITVQDEARELELGKALYDGKPGVFLGQSGRSQADVVRIALEAPRFLVELLRREHRRLLRAEPAPKELAAWARALEADPLAYPSLLRGWILGPGYGRRLAEKIVQPNRLYVRSMYVDLFERLPDSEEERRMRSALDALSDPGPLRSVLARLLLESGSPAAPAKEAIGDPAAWVGGLFERLLGRPAEERELAACVTALHDPACRTATVVYALVSHPEYQTY